MTHHANSTSHRHLRRPLTPALVAIGLVALSACGTSDVVAVDHGDDPTTTLASTTATSIFTTDVPATTIPATTDAPSSSVPESADGPSTTIEPDPTDGPVGSLDDVRSAVVQIEAVGTFVDPEFGAVEGAGRGSGFVISDSNLAVTNNHVVTGAGLLQVWVADEDEPRSARFIGVSECSDLAVIQIDGSPLAPRRSTRSWRASPWPSDTVPNTERTVDDGRTRRPAVVTRR